MLVRFRTLLFALPALFLFEGEASAGSFHVTPTKVILPNDGTATTVKIRNMDERETSVQVLALPWGASEGDSEPTANIIAVPPIADLPPSGEQVIRLAARGLGDETKEKAYLLVIQEIRNQIQSNETGLAFRLHIKIPVFVKATGAKPVPVWSVESAEGGVKQLALDNNGKSHIDIDRMQVFYSSKSKPVFESQNGGYVLAGSKKVWPIEFDRLADSENLTVKADTNIGPIEALITMSDN